MIEIDKFMIATLVWVLALVFVVIWSPRRLRVKVGAFGLGFLFIPLAYAAMTGLLSLPKPISLEWWLTDAQEAEVVASRVVEDEAIYLWLQLPEHDEPRAYELPWDRTSAEELQQALREAERSGGGVQMRMPFEPSLDDGEPKFYALPQPALPPKDLLEPPPEFYEHPSDPLGDRRDGFGI